MRERTGNPVTDEYAEKEAQVPYNPIQDLQMQIEKQRYVQKELENELLSVYRALFRDRNY